MLPNHWKKHCYHVTKPLENTLLPCYKTTGKNIVTMLPNHLKKHCYHVTKPLEKDIVIMLPNQNTLLPCYQTNEKNIVTMLPKHWKILCYHVTKPLENILLQCNQLNNSTMINNQFHSSLISFQVINVPIFIQLLSVLK